MTDKSDAQLDAEAAGRPAYDLNAAISLHRALWMDDCRIPRLVSRQPPIVSEEGERRAQFTHTGMPTSGLLHRRVFEKQPGEMFPWVTAFARLRTWCRRNHPAHTGPDRPQWNGSLCHQAVRLAVIEEWSVPRVALKLRIGDATLLLRSAFRFIEQDIDEQAARREQRAKQDEGVFHVGDPTQQFEHHVVPGFHAEDCPQCRRNAA